MLSAQEKREIEIEARRYANRSAACIDALRIVQHYRGWVADESVNDVADALGMSAEEVDGVATFYSLIYRRPVGRHVLLMCDSVSCWIAGCDRLREHVAARYGIGLGQTTSDGRFTLLPVPCLGACDRAPALLADGDLHGELDAARLDRALEGYR